MSDTAVIIPAKDEADRIVATVTAALDLPGVDLVVVVDDGSIDQTGRVAKAAGARVVRHSRNRGKATAMESGAEAVALLDDGAPRHLLFLDADLGETAGRAAPLIEPVRAGTADMTIAVFSNRVKRGGHGFVVKLAHGFGVETGLTIDLIRKGFRVAEVEVDMAHRATGTDWRAQLHRAKQFRDVARALAVREPVIAANLAKLRGGRP